MKNQKTLIHSGPVLGEAYIGTLLLEAVLKNFGGPISLKCEEKNTNAINFYRHKGFIEIEKGQFEAGPYILLELKSISSAGNASKVEIIDYH